MVTEFPSSVQWTCFGSVEKESCCEGIREANILLSRENLLEDDDYCVSQIAEIPSIQDLPDLALFSLVAQATSKETRDDDRSTILSQVLFDGATAEATHTIHIPTSPFTLQALQRRKDVVLETTLSSNGGMHRIMHHTIQVPASSSRAYLILTIPNAMFVDLDDFVKESADTVIHATGIIDIEQPAFVSGQHVIVVESKQSVEAIEPTTINLEGKVHFRYQDPSSDLERMVSIPPPALVILDRDGSSTLEDLSTFQELPIEVLVAAGNGEDFDLVMWITVGACCVGIILMLRDISHVSQWD